MKNQKSVATVVVTLLVSMFISACSSTKDNDLYKRGYNPQMNDDRSSDYTNSDYMNRDYMSSDRMDSQRMSNDRMGTDNDRTTRSTSNVTAQDQGSSDWDIKTTQMIRQQIVSQDGFSTNAKNVKIITIDGNVYLKGPVQTMAEKNRIESIAKDVAGMTKVNSELKVAR